MVYLYKFQLHISLQTIFVYRDFCPVPSNTAAISVQENV